MFARLVPVLIFRTKRRAKMADGIVVGIHAVLDCSHYILQDIIHVKYKARDGGRGLCINFLICPIVINHWDASVAAGVQAVVLST